MFPFTSLPCLNCGSTEYRHYGIVMVCIGCGGVSE